MTFLYRCLKKPEKLRYVSVLSCLIQTRVTEIKKFSKGHLKSLIMVPYITVNGLKTVIEMEKELKFGKMAVNLSAIGEMTKPTEKVD